MSPTLVRPGVASFECVGTNLEIKMQSMKMNVASRPIAIRRPARVTVVKTKAALDPAIIVSASTAGFLALGRFTFLPYQRREANFDASVPPKTTGSSYFDNLSKPASFTLSTNDPAGFNMIDLFGWGALGHAFAFLVLAISSAHDFGTTPWPTNL